MKPLSSIPPHEVASLRGVVFDLDGTVLDEGGRLALPTYQALHRMADAGLELVACTGRPATWAEVAARQWPITLGLGENGAVAYVRAGEGLDRLDRLDPEARTARRARLEAIVAQLRARHPTLVLADDNLGRLTDVTIDIGERHHVPAETVAAVRRDAATLGARTFLSSIHLHVTLEGDDKASGTVRALRRHLGVDVTTALRQYAFVGDSGNDAACFQAFRLTAAVANVRPYLSTFSRGPRFVSQASMGAGFVEIADALLGARG